MRLLDYILSILREYGFPFVKFGGFFSSLGGALKAFFNWRAKIQERRNYGYWDSSGEKGLFKLMGGSLAVVCGLLLTGYWIYRDNLDNQKTPKSVIESYYNNIMIGNYAKAWDMISPEARQGIYPGGLDEFRRRWEGYKSVKVHWVNDEKGAEVASVVSVSLCLTEQKRNRKQDIDAVHSVGRDDNAEWLITSYTESPPHVCKE